MASGNRTVQVNIVGDSSKLSGAMKKAGDDTTSAASRISSAWRGVASSLSGAFGGALDPVMSQLSGLSDSLDSLHEKGLSVGGAMVGIGAAGLAAGTGLQILGSKEQAASAQLSQAFDNVGASMSDYSDKIDGSVKSMAKFGYTGDQVKTSLAQLVTATKNPAQSLNLLQTAANLAALKHESLSTATEQLVKVVSGKGTKTLSDLGITMAKTGKSGYNVQAALDRIAQATNGQASAAADSYKGKLEALRAELENHVSEIATKYGPAIQGIGAGVTLVGGVVSTYTELTKKAADADRDGAAAKQLLAGATDVASTADDGLAASEGAADAAGIPLIATVGLIVAAVAVLGIGIYELATHWSQVMNFLHTAVTDAWHGIDNDFVQPVEHFFQAIPDFIKSHLLLIATILGGPFGAAAVLIGQHFDQIVSFITGFPNRIAGFAAHMFDGIGNAFKGVVDWIVGMWNDVANATLINLPKVHIPLVGDIGGGSVGPLLPTLPYFAQGGIVTGPTLAMLGDNASGTEAVLPLEKAGQMGFGGSGDVVVPVTLTVDGRVLAQTTARHTRDHLLKTTSRNARKVGLA
jgi:hypothetical protein